MVSMYTIAPYIGAQIEREIFAYWIGFHVFSLQIQVWRGLQVLGVGGCGLSGFVKYLHFILLRHELKG